MLAATLIVDGVNLIQETTAPVRAIEHQAPEEAIVVALAAIAGLGAGLNEISKSGRG